MPATAALPTGRYFECAVTDANLKIQLNGEVLSGIGAAAMGGFTAMRRRSLEMGGLLLGRQESGCVVIEAFEEIVSEHEHGPSWQLSAQDSQVLAAAIRRHNSGRDGMRVVGLYRTQTRAGFAIAQEDAAAMRDFCGAATSVFLLMKPAAAGGSVGMFAAGPDLKATSEVFPFRASAATIESACAPAGAPDAARPRTEQPMPEPDPESIPATTSRRRARIGLALALLAVAFGGGYTSAEWWMSGQKHAARAQTMELRAVWNGTSLDLHWNRESQPIQAATGGMLWIHDGGQYRRVDITRDDLTKGSIVYSPMSRDLVFHLDVFTPQQTVAEWVRAVGLPLPERAPVVEKAALPVTTAAAQLPEAASPVKSAHRRTRNGRR